MAPSLDALASFQARPTQSLADHLQGVVENTDRLLATATTTAYGDDWQTVGQAIAWTHDAGKLTEYFQRYLETDDRSRAADRAEYTYHGFVSALLTAHTLHRLDVSAETRLAGFYAVAKHHGVIPDITEEHRKYTENGQKVTDQYEVASAQLESIDTHASDAADELLRSASDGELTWDDIYVEDPEVYQHLLNHDLDQFSDHFYETVLRAWSTLVCADKLDAAGITVEETPTRPELEAFRSKIEALPDGESELLQELNTLRSSAHNEAHERLCDAHASGERFFRLTLPTGFGKTLTGLRAGLELAEQQNSRLIYALPYTSILDQVDEVCQRFFEVSPTDPAYTVHHHLADTRTNLRELSDADTVSDGSESVYAETWQSGLVLTTFTQLFESLAGPGNTQSMKLPALQDSIIVLDEPQGISIEWWELVSRLAAFVTREYDATVILMTATQPKLFEQSPDLPDPKPLTTQTAACEEFIQRNPRVQFDIHESLRAHFGQQTSSSDSIELDDAAAELRATTSAGSNTLAIVNTIESAGTLTEAVAATFENDRDVCMLGADLCTFLRHHSHDDADPDATAAAYLDFLDDRDTPDAGKLLLTTLTTRLRPRDRAILIAALRRILDQTVDTPFDECPTITVSTQLIEAGVDVSFDRLYRDFAPLPALVQAAGRCNREYEGEVSSVTVWRLAPPNSDGQVPSELIYGRKSLLRPTRKALTTLQDEGSRTIDEATMISRGVDLYYEALHGQRKTGQRLDSLAARFDAGAGEQLREASLIDQDYETQDVVILLTEEDQQQYDRYLQYQNDNRWQRAREKFTELQPMVVSLPVATDSVDDNTPVLDVENLRDDTELYQISTGRGLCISDLTLDIER